MTTVLVSGANRGIGLALVEAFAGAGWRVFAGCRHPNGATELHAVAAANAAVAIQRLDVTYGGQVHALAQSLAGTPIDILINNAGRYGPALVHPLNISVRENVAGLSPAVFTP